MAPTPTLFERLAPLLVGGLLAFLAAAPLGGWLDAITTPNALLAVFALWCLRRQEALSPIVVFVCSIFAEALQDGPFGAQTMALLIATEALRTDVETRRFRPFWIEWSLVAAAAVAVEASIWAVMTATLAPAPPLFALLERAAATTLLYPIVLGVALWGFGFGGRRNGNGDQVL